MTKYRYYIIPPAREEFRLAREWYKQQQVPGLGNQFAQAVKEGIFRIRANPYAFAVRYRDVRIAYTLRFPYVIHYYFQGDLIIITAIIYQGRNPIIARQRV